MAFSVPRLVRLLLLSMCVLLLSACVGRVVGAVVDTTIEVAKVPFKVGGAILDVATPRKKQSNADKRNDEPNQAEGEEE